MTTMKVYQITLSKQDYDEIVEMLKTACEAQFQSNSMRPSWGDKGERYERLRDLFQEQAEIVSIGQQMHGEES